MPDNMSERLTITLSEPESVKLSGVIAEMEKITGMSFARSKVAHDLLVRKMSQ